MSTAFKQTAELSYIYKDPEANLDYQVVWYDWLGTDLISVSTWIVPAGITKVSDTVNGASLVIDGVTYPAGTVTTVWLSGGTLGTRYRLTNRVTTAAGRIDDQSFDVVIKDK
jgi:hypothetical protein